MFLLHPSPVATVALVVLAAVTTLLVRTLLPRRWFPVGVLPTVLVVAGAYVTMRVAAVSGFSEWLDHDVFEVLGGEVDDAPTWLVGSVGATVTVAGLYAIRRVTRRSTPATTDDEQ